MARVRKRREPALGKVVYEVTDPSGAVLTTQPEPAVALVRAQGIAQRDERDTFTVVRRSLFGPATILYRVVRDEHGTIRTYTVSAED